MCVNTAVVTTVSVHRARGVFARTARGSPALDASDTLSAGAGVGAGTGAGAGAGAGLHDSGARGGSVGAGPVEGAATSARSTVVVTEADLSRWSVVGGVFGREVEGKWGRFAATSPSHRLTHRPQNSGMCGVTCSRCQPMLP